MKYSKQLKKMIGQADNSTAMVAVALISGVAVGAALAVLFAPKKGAELRDDISSAPGRLGGTLAELMDAIKAKFAVGAAPEAEPEHQQNGQAKGQESVKKPKSDIGEIIHQAHLSSDPAVQHN